MKFRLIFLVMILFLTSCSANKTEQTDTDQINDDTADTAVDEMQDQEPDNLPEPPDEEKYHWLTGPGSQLHGNEVTYMLPYGVNINGTTYTDEHPVLWETDQGWPVPDEAETKLKYMLFGDTTFLMRDIDGEAPTGHVMNRITYNGETLQQFEVYEDKTKKQIDFYATKFRAANWIDFMGIKASAGDGYAECLPQCHADLIAGDRTCAEICQFFTISRLSRLGYFRSWNNEACNEFMPGYNHCYNNAFFNASLRTAKNGSGGYDYRIKLEKHIASKNDPAGLMAKAVRLNAEEYAQVVSIFPYGYFYACAGGPEDGCKEKKLFIPTSTVNWNPSKEDDNFMKSVEYCGEGIYNFTDEKRIEYTPDGITKNPNILWNWNGKFSKATVVHGLARDSGVRESEGPYIYFAGNGERCINDSGCTDGLAYMERSGGIYMARVAAFENSIGDRAAYSYFKGMENGVPSWGTLEEAKPLPDLKMYAMIPESIIKHKGQFWITVQFSAANDDNSDPDYVAPGEKGFMVFNSADGFNWKLREKIVFDGDGHLIKLFYGIFWLPSGLINPDDNSIPYIYSVWKNNYEWDRSTGVFTDFHMNAFLDESMAPDFTEYNVKMGRYEITEKK